MFALEGQSNVVFAVGKGEIALALVRGTRSILTVYEVPRNGHQHTDPGQGVRSCKVRQAVENCLFATQPVLLSTHLSTLEHLGTHCP